MQRLRCLWWRSYTWRTHSHISRMGYFWLCVARALRWRHHAIDYVKMKLFSLSQSVLICCFVHFISFFFLFRAHKRRGQRQTKPKAINFQFSSLSRLANIETVTPLRTQTHALTHILLCRIEYKHNCTHSHTYISAGKIAQSPQRFNRSLLCFLCNFNFLCWLWVTGPEYICLENAAANCNPRISECELSWTEQFMKLICSDEITSCVKQMRIEIILKHSIEIPMVLSRPLALWLSWAWHSFHHHIAKMIFVLVVLSLSRFFVLSADQVCESFQFISSTIYRRRVFLLLLFHSWFASISLAWPLRHPVSQFILLLIVFQTIKWDLHELFGVFVLLEFLHPQLRPQQIIS